MLGVGGFPPPSAPPVVLMRPTFPPLPNYSSFFPGRTGFCLFAQKKQQNPGIGGIKLEEREGFEEEGFEIDEDDGFGDFEFDEEDEEDVDVDDEDDVIVPFHKMNAWLKKKPRGFGEGKVYDTSIEDELLEEIEQSRKAQLANLNRLKDKSKVVNAKRELKEEPKGVLAGIRVRINNLPKKKNIHRDLKSAFEGVPGIINISPVVCGNKKTRDPACKGIAFVDFRSLEDSNRFVQMFSGQNITFGKVEKNIKCEILNSSDAGHDGSAYYRSDSTCDTSFMCSEEEEDEEDSIEQDDPQLQFWKDDDSDESDEDLDDEDVIRNFKSLRAPENGDIEGRESRMMAAFSSLSSKLEEKTKAVKKKPMVKKKPEKNPKLKIPGSAKSLKVREKAKLAEVFSRYHMG